MATALFAGSFDPVHRGHVGLIETAAGLFDHVWVGAIGNPNKPTGRFSLEQRHDLLVASTAHLSNVGVVVHHGLTVDLARDLGADTLVRSIGKERALEFEMAHVNERLSGLPTVMLFPEPELAHISSRLVRQCLAAGDIGAAAELVPPPVAAVFRELTAPA